MRRIGDLSIRKKLVFMYIVSVSVILVFNLINFYQVGRYVAEIDQVYATNVGANELSDKLSDLQASMYNYLVSKSSENLEQYYADVSDYEAMIEELNNETVADQYLMCEKTIRLLSVTYLKKTERTIQAKRGRNVEYYKSYYEDTQTLYGYINDYINNLNNERLNANSIRYQQLCKDLKRLETTSMFAIVAISAICLIVMSGFAGSIVRPLTKLAQKAEEVAQGNFQVTLLPMKNEDEINVVIRAFNTMVHSISLYVQHIQESSRKEQEMKEKELRMEVLLKDARLKYLRAQINPHFLYNALNTCAQLALLENAEQTAEFVERMAEFFRYNVRRTVTNENPLCDELRAVDAYVYIQNVRFDGEIHMTKRLDEGVEKIMVPCMILQPIVENAFNHGIRELDRKGEIELIVEKKQDCLVVHVKDNGHGMTKERIKQVLGKNVPHEEEEKSNESYRLEQTGIGVDNVMNRLEVYYGRNDLFEMISEGIEKGTEVIITLPFKGTMQEEENVSDIIGG